MMRSPKVAAISSLAALLLLSACGASQTNSQESAASPSSPAASTSAPSSTPTATVTPSAQPSPTATAPSPKVIEETPAPGSEVTPQPVPTGTVTTVDPTPASTGEPPHEASEAPRQAPSSAAGVAVCDYGQLYISAAVADGAGAAGSRYITLTFTNTGGSDCAMSGYPSVHYVDASNHQVGASAAHATEWSASGTVLGSNQSVSATLRETRAQLFGESCQAQPSAGYSVQAPGASQALVLNFPAEACSNSQISQLSVGAVGANP